MGQHPLYLHHPTPPRLDTCLSNGLLIIMFLERVAVVNIVSIFIPTIYETCLIRIEDSSKEGLVGRSPSGLIAGMLTGILALCISI